MLIQALILLAMLGGAPRTGCVDKCTADISRCSERCGANQSCMDRCNKRSASCMDSCTAANEKTNDAQLKKNSQMPCAGDLQKMQLTPCSEKEAAQMREVVKGAKALCKDPEGNAILCPGEAEKLEKHKDKFTPKLDCKDSQGLPALCPKK